MIDFSDVARPTPNFHAQQQTRLACAAMIRHEREFVAGALSASELSFDRWSEAAVIVRARLCPELYAALTRHTTTTLARAVMCAPVLLLSLN
jgi:hypothetical protein